jgi:hypothetical protein
MPLNDATHEAPQAGACRVDRGVGRHAQTVRDLIACCRAWEPDVRILGNVRAADAADALAYMLPELEAEELYSRPPCMECGAATEEDAGRMCRGGGDKDDCHGNTLWP